MARSTLYRSFYLAAVLFLLSAAADAQLVIRRTPSSRVTQAPTPVPQAPSAQKAETRRSVDDNVIQVQPAPDRDQRAQTRRRDDNDILRDRPRIPDMQRPQMTPPYIFASPNQVKVKPNESYGFTVIMWDGGDRHPYAEIWRRVEGGADEFLFEKGKGETGAKIELGRTYTYILTDNGRTLDTVTVTAAQELTEMPGGLKKRPGRETEQNMGTLITDERTESRISGVKIGFFAPGNSSPQVEFGTTAPRVVGGRYVFPGDNLLGGGSAIASRSIKKVGVTANTFHSFDLALPLNSSLEPGTQHWYIITGQNPGGDPETFQTTGTFTTASQTVRVVFEKVRIIDDSDELSDGDIKFWGWINDDLPGEQSWENRRSSMGSGETYDLGRDITIKNAQNLFKIAVSADDDDCSIGCAFGNEGTPDPIYGFYNNKKEYDGNGAWDEWDLSRFATRPGETYRHAFTLKSREGEAKLRFEVTGYWEITRN